MSNIREICKDRILTDMIRAVQPAGRSTWKVLLVDQESMRIISACCKMYDIMEENVTVVEKIDIPRQPLPDLDAIYFLTPTTASVDLLIADFKKKDKPMYAHVHLFFTSKLPDSEFQKIASSPLASRIKALKEFNLEFVPYESQVYHFDMKESMVAFFSPESNDAPRHQFLVANRIVTLMAALNEYPIIRFSKSHPLSSTLATAVQTRLDQLVRTAVGWTPQEDRATLLILDRTIDTVAPLLHEFTYQAMVNDLLDIKNDIYQYHAETDAGTKNREVLLREETDVLWPVLRHMHIADTMSYVIDNFNDFLKTNKVTQYASGKKQVEDTKSMSEAMRAMPQYKEMLGKYSLHMSLSSSAMDSFNALALERTASVEQDMATGEDADGKTVKNIITRLPEILADPTVSREDKMRILMLYIITQDGVPEKDRKRLMDLAGATLKEQAAIANLFYLGVTLTKGAKGRKTKKDVKKKKKRGGDVPFELSRFVPNVKDVVDNLLSGSLSPAEFPFVKDDPGEQAGSRGSTGPAAPQKTSLKGAGSKQPRWADKDKGKKKEEPKQVLQGARVIIFIAGGMTLSEMRTAYELTTKYQRPVFIGSTHIITPKQFMSDLGLLKQTTAM